MLLLLTTTKSIKIRFSNNITKNVEKIEMLKQIEIKEVYVEVLKKTKKKQLKVNKYIQNIKIKTIKMTIKTI